LEISYKNRHADIIDRCRGGDQKAYHEIYQLYSKAMFNICYRIIGEQELAEDMLQEAFVSAFRNIESYEGRASFGAWLKKIVVNKAISHLRKQRVEFEEFDDRLELSDGEPYDDTELALKVESVREAIQKLPKGFRVVFSLYLLEGYDHKEIAGIVGISESTSKSQYNRAKKKLREILKKEMHYG
jgi:RNA polymerase sigma-70 factor (ECF subfamily)